MSRRRSLLPVMALLAVSACSLRSVSCGATTGTNAPDSTSPEGLGPSGWTPPSSIGVAFLGDSLTAGLGLLTEQAYPALIQEMLLAEGYGEVEVINAGLSGDTTAGGLRRVEQILQPDVYVLVVALGGNDALRGLSVTDTYDNLSAIVDIAQTRSVFVLLAGMLAPTNLGDDYRTAFSEVFQTVAVEHRVAFVPFLLEGVAGDPALNQADGIHPNAAGARRIAELLYPEIRNLVDQSLASAGPIP